MFRQLVRNPQMIIQKRYMSHGHTHEKRAIALNLAVNYQTSASATGSATTTTTMDQQKTNDPKQNYEMKNKDDQESDETNEFQPDQPML